MKRRSGFTCRYVLQVSSHPEGKPPASHHTKQSETPKKIHASESKCVVPFARLTLRSTYILDIIGGDMLVVGVYGAFRYDNNVQPFLIGAILEGNEEAKAGEHMTENVLHSQKLDLEMGDRLTNAFKEHNDVFFVYLVVLF